MNRSPSSSAPARSVPMRTTIEISIPSTRPSGESISALVDALDARIAGFVDVLRAQYPDLTIEVSP